MKITHKDVAYQEQSFLFPAETNRVKALLFQLRVKEFLDENRTLGVKNTQKKCSSLLVVFLFENDAKARILGI